MIKTTTHCDRCYNRGLHSKETDCLNLDKVSAGPQRKVTEGSIKVTPWLNLEGCPDIQQLGEMRKFWIEKRAV